MAVSAQVFVDDSGRRRRWVRLAGAAVTALCVGYIGIVAIGLSQTQVGPLQDVPPGNNGQIAGFPASDGSVPGLLQNPGAGKSTGQGGHAAVPTRKAPTTLPRINIPRPTPASRIPLAPPGASAPPTSKPKTSSGKGSPSTSAPPTKSSSGAKASKSPSTKAADPAGSKGT